MSTAYSKNMQTEWKYIFKRACPYFSLSVSYDKVITVIEMKITSVLIYRERETLKFN